MKKVTQKEFYATIGNQDCVLSIIGDSTEFKLRHSNKLIGKTIDYKLEDTEFFLPINEHAFIHGMENNEG